MKQDAGLLIRRFYEELWNRGDTAIADELFARDYIRHELRPGVAPAGPEGQKAVATLFRQAFPDVELTVDLLIVADLYVVARWPMRGTHSGPWADVPPSGRRIIFSGANIFRFSGGKVVELWNRRDDLGLMEQAGTRIYAGCPGSTEP